MAIEINLKKDKNDVGIDFNSAYLKIYDVEIRVKSDEVWIKLLIYGNAEARNTPNTCSIVKKTERLTLVELNPKTFDKDGIFQASYNWLKKKLDYIGIDK